MVLVSACLVGKKCRYDGNDSYHQKVADFVKENQEEVILICPEEMGGLNTPRCPCEIVGRSVQTKTGKDFTSEFELGAEKVRKIIKTNHVTRAIMKSKSPSCGCGQIYDGSFTGKLTSGNGITVEMLLENNVEVITEDDL